MLANRRTCRDLAGRPYVKTLRVCVAAWHQVAVELAGSVRRGTAVTVEGYLSRDDPRTASNARAQIVVVAQWVEKQGTGNRERGTGKETTAAGREPQRQVADATARPPNRPVITTAPPTQLPLEGLST
jgi:single-stranded DNA-binding protein